MAAVQLSGASWSASPANRLGPFQDNSGNLWIIARVTGAKISAYKSSDGGATWTTHYDYSSGQAINSADAIFDSAAGIIYVGVDDGTNVRIYSFTFSDTTWRDIYSSGTRPSISTDAGGIRQVFLTRRSTGEFVVAYQGPTHSSMGSSYRSVYYARCSSAGVWSAGVEVDTGGAYHWDCISACLGASNRVHILHANAGNFSHRSLSSANALDTSASAGGSGSYGTIFYDSTIGRLFTASNANIYRSQQDSGAANPQTWAAEGGFPSASNDNGNSSFAFIYDPTGAKLYIFYRDFSYSDVYKASCAIPGTTWTGYDQQDAATSVTGISVGLITDAIGVVFRDTNVYFDKLVLSTPSPITGQTHYRFRNDNDDEANATWMRALDTGLLLMPGEQYRLRFAIAETNGVAVSTSAYRLRCSVNGGAYNDIPGNAAPAASSSIFAGPVATTKQISTGTFGTGKLVELGSDAAKYTADLSIPANGVTEIEFTLVVPAGQGVGDTLDFRIYDANGNALGSYSQTPRVTVIATTKWVDFAGVDFPFALDESTLMRYGAAGHGWLQTTLAAGSYEANPTTFGDDPAPGYQKIVQVLNDSAAAIYWKINFEPGVFDNHWWISHWSGTGGDNLPADVGYTDLTIVTNPVYEGVYAGRFKCDPTADSGTPSDRCEALSSEWQAAGFEGQETWYRWASLLPGPPQEWWPTGGGWNGLMQLAPPYESWMGVGINAVNIPHIVWNYGEYQADLTHDLAYDHWYLFWAHIKWSTDPQVGLLEIALDGDLKLSTAFSTIKPTFDRTRFSLGLYRAPWDHTNTVVHDGILRSLVPLSPYPSSKNEEFFALL